MKSSDERLQLLRKISKRQPIPAVAEKDENDIFFGSMAKIVKTLPPYDQVHLRMQISLLVGNPELKYFGQQSPYSCPSTSGARTSSGSDYYDNGFFSDGSSRDFLLKCNWTNVLKKVFFLYFKFLKLIIFIFLRINAAKWPNRISH
jgi:hypothetical protein